MDVVEHIGMSPISEIRGPSEYRVGYAEGYNSEVRITRDIILQKAQAQVQSSYNQGFLDGLGQGAEWGISGLILIIGGIAGTRKMLNRRKQASDLWPPIQPLTK